MNMNDFLTESYDCFVGKLDKLTKYLPNLKEYNLDIDFLMNVDLSNKIIQIFDKFDIEQISVEKLDNLLQNLHNELSQSIKNYNEANFTYVVEDFCAYKKISIYSNLIQCLLEGSFISNHIIENLKNVYGDNYLSVIQEVDLYKPSELTNFKAESVVNGEHLLHNKFVALYLELKHWKDLLHKEFYEQIEPIASKSKKQFFEFVYKDFNYLNTLRKFELYSAYVLNSAGVVGVENLAKFVKINFYKHLSRVFGGKNIGLAILYNAGVNIPKTICLSIDCVKKGDCDKVLSLLNSGEFYAVRSSATVEDNDKQSFAGMFDSLIGVGYEDIENAIKSVHNSVFSERVKEYVKHFNVEQPEMAVVVQEFNVPERSGVWIGAESNSGRLEWVEDLGEKLVSGHTTPNVEMWIGGESEKGEHLKVGNEIVGELCLNLQKTLKSALDLEFCLMQNKMIFLQCRPVTQKILLEESGSQGQNADDEEGEVVSGLGVSAGEFEGKPIYLEDYDDGDKFETGAILLVDYTDPEWVPIMLKCRAIVSAEGGMLSHTAIIARELKIPCITSVGYKNLSKLSKCNKIKIDANKGKITILE